MTDPNTTRLCLDPWQYLEFSASGEVSLCCKRPPFGTFPRQSLAEIRNGQAARTLRSGLLSGNLDDYCRLCHIRAPTSPADLKEAVHALFAEPNQPG